MKKFKGSKAYLISGKEFEDYFSELLDAFVLEERPKFQGSKSHSFDIDSVYEDFKKFVTREIDRIFKEHKIAAIVVMFDLIHVQIVLKGRHFFEVAERNFSERRIKSVLEEMLDFRESFYGEEETKLLSGIKEYKTSKLLSHFGLLDFKDKEFKKGGR